MKFANTTKIVKYILENNPKTRDDDCLLWLETIRKVAIDNETPDFTKTMNIATFLSNVKLSAYPQYETVSRVRRKLQRRYPLLQASNFIKETRAATEKQFRQYAQKRDIK